MGLKYTRDYDVIIDEVVKGIEQLEKVYAFIGMTPQEWKALSRQSKAACIRTMADDVFFMLGEQTTIFFEEESIDYDSKCACICFHYLHLPERRVEL